VIKLYEVTNIKLVQIELDSDFLNKVLSLSLVNKKNIYMIERKDSIKDSQSDFST